MRIVDSGARLPPASAGDPRGALLAEMDRAGIERMVVAPSDAHVAVDNDEGNALVADLARRCPGRISGLATANPWYGARAVESLRRAFGEGLAGLYLNPGRQGFLLTEGIVHPLIEACARHGKAVWSSTGTPVFAMPFQLAELARRYTDVPFVMGHAAWSDFSGYDIVPAARQAANIVIDVSCTVGSIVSDAVEALGADRIVFCSAYPKSRPLIEIAKIMRLRLPDAALERIFYHNAERLWGPGA